MTNTIKRSRKVYAGKVLKLLFRNDPLTGRLQVLLLEMQQGSAYPFKLGTSL